MSDLSGQPRAVVNVGGNFIPVESLTVEQSLYGSADAAHVDTFLYDLSSTAGGQVINLGAMSQQTKYIPVTIAFGNTASPAALHGTQLNQLFYGFLEELDADWGMDKYTISARGALALLVDQRISQRIPMNVDIGTAIAGLITTYGYGLTPQVGVAGVQVGHVLTADYVSLNRNVRVFDLIQLLAQGVGWDMRVKGTTVIVGVPPVAAATQNAVVAAGQSGAAQVPIFVKEWQKGAGTALTVKHNALHSHNIKVTVVSYINGTKSPTTGISGQGQTAALLGLPAPLASTGYNSLTALRSGPQAATTSVGEGASNDEEYIFHIPGLTAAQCIAKATLIRDEISRHEFIAELTWSPSSTELASLVQASPEFAIQLTGAALHQQGHDQLYYPRQITWNYSLTGGLTVTVLMVNHPIPTETGGE
jgi:hypothetical protein